jgi:hypothetical protein
MADENERCTFPDKCKNPVYARGLCKTHYATCAEEVRRNPKVTWELLAKRGVGRLSSKETKRQLLLDALAEGSTGDATDGPGSPAQ